MKKESLLKFYADYRLFIFPAVVALSSLFLIIFAIYPQTLKLIENQKLTVDLSNKSTFLENKVIALESFDEADLSKKAEVVLNILPSEKDYGNILSLMQQSAAKSGFSITSIALNESGGKVAQTNGYTVKLQVKGVKALFQNLLNSLEAAPRLMKIASIEISSNQSAQVIEASLTIDVLYSGIPQNFGSADSPLPQISQKDEELLANLAKVNETNVISNQQSSSTRGKANPFE